jgi:hypothetical protein
VFQIELSGALPKREIGRKQPIHRVSVAQVITSPGLLEARIRSCFAALLVASSIF